jgi:hypothetical protein
MRIEENARSRSLQKKEEESVTVGSHPNFPKEPGPSDQTEAVREIYHREKPRRNPEMIWTVHLDGHVAARRSHRHFGVREFIEQRTMTTKTPKSRDAKSRNNLNRQINMRSRPSI